MSEIYKRSYYTNLTGLWLPQDKEQKNVCTLISRFLNASSCFRSLFIIYTHHCEGGELVSISSSAAGPC